MENEPELIRDQMQDTRTAMTEKLDTLQQKVTDTVESITTPVTETVQTVKAAVTDTVGTVKETFDLSRQVERHPWPMMLGAVAAGFALGRLLPPPRKLAGAARPRTDPVAARMSQSRKGHNGFRQAVARQEEPPPPAKQGVFGGLGEALQGEMDKIKGLGISIGAGLLRDLMTQSMHGEIGGRLKEWMDGLTEKLGGKPLAEPVVSPRTGEEAPSEKPKRETRGQDEKGKPPADKGKSTRESARRW